MAIDDGSFATLGLINFYFSIVAALKLFVVDIYDLESRFF